MMSQEETLWKEATLFFTGTSSTVHKIHTVWSINDTASEDPLETLEKRPMVFPDLNTNNIVFCPASLWLLQH